MKRSKAPVSVSFLNSDAASKVSAKYFAGAFKGSEGEVVWRPSSSGPKDGIDLFVGCGKSPTALTLAKATHSALRRARQLERENIRMHVPPTGFTASYSDVAMLDKMLQLGGTSSNSSNSSSKKKKKENKKDGEEEEGKKDLLEKLSHESLVEKMAHFAELSAYEWNTMKTTPKATKTAPSPLTYKANVTITPSSSKKKSSSNSSSERKAIATGKIIGQCVNAARTMHNMRPNICTPDYFAKDMLRFARGKSNVRVVTHLRGEQLKKHGLNLMHSVGKASCDPGNLVVLEYTGNPRSKETTALVGKGVVMDTGGLNVKSFGNMETMFLDKGGACAVLGAFRAVVELKLPVNLVATVGLVNNAIGGNAVQPGEIVRSLNGLQVVVDNTDAEGRLVLADCMTWVQREARLKKKVTRMVDLATLTGACVVALGNHRAGIFGGDVEQMRDLIAASNTAMEPLWPLPIGPENHKAMRHAQADMTNCAAGRYGGASSAAAFLQRFVEKDVKWAHLDIAGPGCFTTSGERHTTGSQGFGVSLLVEWLRATQC